MGLVSEQWEFLMDVATLIQVIEDEEGLIATAGEMFRTQEQQDLHLAAGRSTVKRSLHQDRLAIDLNFFADGKYLGAVSRPEILEILEPVGSFWESLSPKNRWGGRWTSPFDPWHFERHV